MNKSSRCILLRTIIGNTNSTAGNNFRNIELETGLVLDVENVKAKLNRICDELSFAEIPEEELWRIAAARELSLVKSIHLFVDGFASDELEEMLRFICTS